MKSRQIKYLTQTRSNRLPRPPIAGAPQAREPPKAARQEI